MSNSFREVQEDSVPRSLPICFRSDVIRARQLGSDVAEAMGFGQKEQRRITTAISELTRNVLQHSGTTGKLSLEIVEKDSRRGLLVLVEDHGQGIPDRYNDPVDDSATSVRSLGAGLPSCKRLMDEFEIVTEMGQGTLVRMTIWLSNSELAVSARSDVEGS